MPAAKQHRSGAVRGPGKGQPLPFPTPKSLFHRFVSVLGNWLLHIRLGSALEAAFFSSSFWKIFLVLNKERTSFELRGEDELGTAG